MLTTLYKNDTDHEFHLVYHPPHVFSRFTEIVGDPYFLSATTREKEEAMQWIRPLVLAVVITLVMTTGWIETAGAESGTYHNYGQIRLGLNAFSGDMEDADYDTDVNLGIAYGRYLAPHLVFEAALDVFGADKEMRGSTPTAGSYKRDDTMAVMALLATIKGELPAGPLTFFAGGGVGGYFLALNSEIDTAYLGDLDKDDNDTVIGVHAVAGVDYNITQRFFAGLHGLYRWTDDIDINASAGTVPVRLEGDLDGYSVMLTGGFRF
jgi:opacity protein-like surface antigen